MRISTSFSSVTAPNGSCIASERQARRLDIPKELPIGLTDRFSSDHDKIRQWNAFTNRSGLTIQVGDLATVVQEVRSLLDPILDILLAEESP